jgi:hypothetical protein
MSYKINPRIVCLLLVKKVLESYTYMHIHIGVRRVSY